MCRITVQRGLHIYSMLGHFGGRIYRKRLWWRQWGKSSKVAPVVKAMDIVLATLDGSLHQIVGYIRQRVSQAHVVKSLTRRDQSSLWPGSANAS